MRPGPLDLSQLDLRLRQALALKALPRAGWLRAGVDRPESVAAHSWGVAYLVLALCPDGLDLGRALAIAVIHDLAEVSTGDITPHDGVARAEKARREAIALARLVAPLPRAESLVELWRELEEGSSPEGRFVKACDRLDMALQARCYAAEQGADTAEFVESALAELDDPDLRILAASPSSTEDEP
jgi:putative hydrolase of HD superfamily